MKSKLLCILHRSPPNHGAAKVGDFISESKKLQKMYDCKFITIKSSDTIGDIGKVNFKKLYFVVELYIKIFIALVSFRPDKIYFTSSVNGVAFYRDVLISTLWKAYGFFTKVDIYYHYHTKGIDGFASSSSYKLALTNFFVKNITIILLSPLLKKDLDKISGYKNILYLPNGVEDNYTPEEFKKYINEKKFEDINVLYLSNMIKSKGYFEVLKLAQRDTHKNATFHFAGGWQNLDDEKDFFDYIKKYHLENKVIFHGFINGQQKKELFEKSHILLFPTRYSLESFGLVIIEAFSYGIPVISTNEASIPDIIDNNSGIVINSLDSLSRDYEIVLEKYVNLRTSIYCRKRYLDNFSLDIFEDNLIQLIL